MQPFPLNPFVAYGAIAKEPSRIMLSSSIYGNPVRLLICSINALISDHLLQKAVHYIIYFIFRLCHSLIRKIVSLYELPILCYMPVI